MKQLFHAIGLVHEIIFQVLCGRAILICLKSESHHHRHRMRGYVYMEMSVFLRDFFLIFVLRMER